MDAMFNDRSSLLAHLATRRSGKARDMIAPGPDAAQLHDIIALALRTPDHGKLAPWRIVSVAADQRGALAALLKTAWIEENPGAAGLDLSALDQFAHQAPSLLVLLSTPVAASKIPVWEQQMSAGAVCMNILLAATALGIGCQWNTDWVAYDAGIASVMGLQPHEKVAGIMYFGTSTVELEDRPRPDAMSLVTRWQAS